MCVDLYWTKFIECKKNEISKIFEKYEYFHPRKKKGKYTEEEENKKKNKFETTTKNQKQTLSIIIKFIADDVVKFRDNFFFFFDVHFAKDWQEKEKISRK